MTVSGLWRPLRPRGMVAKFNGKCQDRCGLKITAGHDDVERGHFGYRHVDCEMARMQRWIRDRINSGDSISDAQVKLMATGDLNITTGTYVIDYWDGLYA